MRRACASGLLVWLWAFAVQAAPGEAPALPGLVDDAAEPPSESPTPEPSPPEPSPAPEEVVPAPMEEPGPAPTETPAETFAPFDGNETPSAATPSSPPPAPTPPAAAAASPAPAAATAAPAPAPADASKSKDAKSDEQNEEKSDAKSNEKQDEKQQDEESEPIKHKGFIVDLRVGFMGCTRLICKRHDAKPGLRLDGMLGRNFFGILDIGLAGAWGRMRTNVAPGTDGLSLYGLDPDALPPEAAALMFDQFTVNDAHFETIQAGLNLRVHVIPRGRFDPYVGIGAQYSLLRALYDTPAGETRLGFHGLAFPVQGGFVYFVHENIAVGAQFDWLITWYGGITVRGAPGRLGAPIPLIKDAAAEAGVNLPGDLPHFWTLGAVAHFRFGK